MITRFWRFASSINLTIWLLLAITLVLGVGSRYAKALPKVYGHLNIQRFQEWVTGNGLEYSWWVWLLFLLLTLFAFNTAACTGERIWTLVSGRRAYSAGSFAIASAPSLMHLCFLVIISGHAVSQFAADIREIPVVLGKSIDIADATVTITGSSCTFYEEPLLVDMARQCSAEFTLTGNTGLEYSTITVLQPLFLGEYWLHLTRAGRSPKGSAPAMNLVVKNDPGLPLIIFGNGLLCLFMLGYFPLIVRTRNGG